MQATGIHTYQLQQQLRRILTGWYIWILPIEYVLWNNGGAQTPMQYWLKSFNVKPFPVPGIMYTVSQIQLRKSMHLQPQDSAQLKIRYSSATYDGDLYCDGVDIGLDQ